MTPIVKYFQHTSGRVKTYRALQNGDFVFDTQGRDLSGEEGYVELSPDDYDQLRASELSARISRKAAAVERHGALTQLAAKADNLLGGIL